MEHTQANPKTHTCATCGYEWLHGQHGGHNCATRLKAQRDELLAIVKLLTLATDEGDDKAQGTHYVDKAGVIRCKGSFLALIESARALIAKHKGASHG